MTSNPIIIILVVAVCTIFTRAFPFILFSGHKEIPKTIKRLGDLLPPAVIGILIVFCLQDVSIVSLSKWAPSAISVLVVVLLHVWKRNNLLSIGAGTVLYMLLVQVVFV